LEFSIGLLGRELKFGEPPGKRAFPGLPLSGCEGEFPKELMANLFNPLPIYQEAPESRDNKIMPGYCKINHYLLE
jgi:hypothetical protein